MFEELMLRISSRISVGVPRSSDGAAAAFPFPVEPEPLSMQADDRVGLDQQEGLAPFGRIGAKIGNSPWAGQISN